MKRLLFKHEKGTFYQKIFATYLIGLKKKFQYITFCYMISKRPVTLLKRPSLFLKPPPILLVKGLSKKMDRRNGGTEAGVVEESKVIRD